MHATLQRCVCRAHPEAQHGERVLHEVVRHGARRAMALLTAAVLETSARGQWAQGRLLQTAGLLVMCKRTAFCLLISATSADVSKSPGGGKAGLRVCAGLEVHQMHAGRRAVPLQHCAPTYRCTRAAGCCTAPPTVAGKSRGRSPPSS